MLIKIPDIVKGMVEGTEEVKTVLIKNTKWYLISEEELKTLINFVREVDSVPEDEWRNYPENEILANSFNGNAAARIVNNSVIIDTVNDKGYRERNMNKNEYV